MNIRTWIVAAVGLVVVTLLGASTMTAAPRAVEEWGTIKGQIIFDGAQVPERENLKVEKDTDHCLSQGPIKSERWVVDPKTKGVQWVMVYLKASTGETLPIHDNLKTPTGQAEIDQPLCHFVPHVIGVREGQKFVAKNPGPVAHNVIISGVRNTYNVQIPPGGNPVTFNLVAEPGPMSLSCGAHPWMKGNIWVFKHPYFAVTDADGRFEIKVAPAGKRNLVIWHEEAAFPFGRTGQAINVNPGDVVDLGQIKIKGK